MAGKLVSAELYTTGHRILGRMNPGAVGVLHFLNIPMTSFVEIEGAHVNRLHKPSRLAARYPRLWLAKQRIVAVLLSEKSEIGRTWVARRGYASAVSHRVRAILGGFELEGVVETAGKFEFGSLVFEGDRLFTPMYDAELVSIRFSGVRARSEAVLYNRVMVEAMALIPREDDSK